MTQLDLARRVALRPETICRIEKQRQAAGLDAIHAIARELGVPPECLSSGVDAAPIASEPKRAQRPPSERRCKDCGLVKPISAYVPIKQSRTGVYGRCRVCRARRARERYQSDPTEREAQKARVRRNDLKRAAAAAATPSEF